MKLSELEQFLRTGTDIVKSAGEMFRQGTEVKELQTEVERFLESETKKAFPNAVVQFDSLNSQRMYVNQQSAIQILYALIDPVTQQPVAGIMYDPEHKVTVTALKEDGAFLEYEDRSRERLHTRDIAKLTSATILFNKSQILDKAVRKLVGYLAVPSCEFSGESGNNLLGVARERDYRNKFSFDHGFIDPRPVPENKISAGHVVLEEAGGQITDKHGNPLKYNKPNPIHDGVVASGGKIQKPLVEDAKLILNHTEEQLHAIGRDPYDD